MRLDYRSPSVVCQEDSVPGVVTTLLDGRRRKQGTDPSAPSNESREGFASPSLLSESPPKVVPAAAWGTYIERFPWDWFVTLTFRGFVGEWGAERKFRRLVRKMRNDAGHRVEWVRVTEWHKFRNVPHYHALFLDCGQLRRMEYVDWWWGNGFGSARVVAYDTQLGAGHYLGKYLTKEASDLSLSRGLKRFATGVPDDSQGLPLMPSRVRQRPAG